MALAFQLIYATRRAAVRAKWTIRPPNRFKMNAGRFIVFKVGFIEV
jgi:hypothetical protein